MEEQHIWTSDSNSTISSSTIGRVMNSVLTSRPKKLEDAIYRLGSSSQRSAGSLEEPLCILRKYVRDSAGNEEMLDQILVPMIENSLKWKDSKHGNQVIILLNWLFQDEFLFKALVNNLVTIITRKDDRYITLGWCTLIRGLIDEGINNSQSANIGIHIQVKYHALLKDLCSSIQHLTSVISNGGTIQDGFELPTRLSVAAADCILVLTEALTRKASSSGVSSVRKISPDSDNETLLVTSAPNVSGEKKVKSITGFPLGTENMEMGFLLWEHLDELIILVLKLLAWSRKSRPLHAKGLEQVLKWLQEIKEYYNLIQDEAGGDILRTGVLTLTSCWKHYGVLLRLDDRRFSHNYTEMLNQYMSGIQFYMNDYADEHSGNKDGGIETRKFFLSCIGLLLGRLDSKQFDIAMSEQGLQIAGLVLSQLQCVDEDVIEGAVSILRAVIFKINYSSTGSSPLDTQQTEEVFPLLLNLLDERDNIARAVVLLIAEYCTINTNGQCLQGIFERLTSGNPLQRKNAVDVISELIRVTSDSGNLLPLSIRKELAKHLISCLGDDELVIRVQISKLFPMIDPSLVLPELVHLVYSPEERVQSSATDAISSVLKCHNQNPELIVILLDCLSNLCQNLSHQRTPSDGGLPPTEKKFDAERVLRLVPEWSKSVQDWNIFIKPLVDKMFAEPSNAIIVRFLSYISDHLADAPDVVLRHVLSYMQGQEEIDEKLMSKGVSGTDTCDDSLKLKGSLFDRLCPLLIIRLLPLRVFNDLSSSVMYGQFLNQDIVQDNRDSNFGNRVGVAACLVKRACNKFEFEDVRKLAAELCGRIHPQVLYPIIQSQLEHATRSRDLLKIKTCLFATCTSLVLRGSYPAQHSVMVEMRRILEVVLMWPSLDDDEVSKAQHGCIDCLALMICAELQTPDSSQDPSRNNISILGKGKSSSHGDVTVRYSVHTYVMQQLTHDWSESFHLNKWDSPSHLVRKLPDPGCVSKASVPLSFRLCMANVIISACQKISSSGKKPLAKRTLPVLIHSVEVITDSEVRAACIQVLFSAVYHLKTAILPYSSNLFKLAVKALREGSEKEKMAGVKLMASLMASEEEVVESISSGLLEASSLLSNISLMGTSSSELKQVCEKLLACVSSPLDKL